MHLVFSVFIYHSDFHFIIEYKKLKTIHMGWPEGWCEVWFLPEPVGEDHLGEYEVEDLPDTAQCTQPQVTSCPQTLQIAPPTVCQRTWITQTSPYLLGYNLANKQTLFIELFVPNRGSIAFLTIWASQIKMLTKTFRWDWDVNFSDFFFWICMMTPQFNKHLLYVPNQLGPTLQTWVT